MQYIKIFIKMKQIIKNFWCVCKNKLAFSWQNHMWFDKLSLSRVALFCYCSKCMDDWLPPGGATMQLPRYVISCVTMAMNPACIQQSMMSPGCEYLAWLMPNCTTLLAACNLSLGQWESWGEIKFVPMGEKERITHSDMNAIFTMITKIFTLPLCQAQT